jgi:hypothetical protein
MQTSGQIILIDKDEFYPGDIGLVEIHFLNKEYLGKDFSINKKFTFGEDPRPFGEGEVKEIL